ncbi:ion channel [Glutamicibacter sp.]|uniref:ion channel n=1 Tax=Glutamicibacter sp. TaxID=1931995 RepID=UPI0028BDD07F|nr:ion channel [Glutamicibacter sp.]
MNKEHLPPQGKHKNRKRDVLRSVVVAISLMVLFLTVPISHLDPSPWWLILLAVASVAVLLTALVRLINHGASLFRLLNLLMIVAMGFAFGFYGVAVHMPGQFEGISTRVDALYFTLTTMTTTGYGDVHPTGQLARILVSLALVFDVIFLGLVGGEISRHASERRSRNSGIDQ